ncbi:Hairy/enhancer-of-split with YRPW motif protein 2 [Elasticomyces elasticus]|nr:Hairy/enhancer-of-split with YRPW motif protein 2 [Elasticomyces elasticus]
MEYDTKVAPSSTADKNSFAFISARDRWPIILTSAIDDVHRAVSKETDAEKQEEGKSITQGLAKLKYELQHDRQLTQVFLNLHKADPLLDNGQPDIASYNAELEARGNPKWFDVAWLYAECYLYRRMATLFSTSTHWKRYDVFSKQKMSTFRSSRPAVLELAARYNDMTRQLESGHSVLENASEEEREKAEQTLFTEMCEICLWGNATDLSLLTNLSYEDIQKLQGSESRKANEEKILVNDFAAAFACLKTAQKAGTKERRVDIVLDNAGFELFVDLVLAGYLLESGLATHIVLHPKNIPWFVSDVVPKDFSDLLTVLVNAKHFYETASEDEKADGVSPETLSEADAANMKTLFESWSALYAEGKMLLRPNGFWTEGGSYWRMPKTASSLFDDLKESELVIFKGDLNYRKLTGDALWDPATPFTEAIGPLGPTSGIRVLTLRTCKADVVVGLPKGKDEELRAMEGGGGDSGARKWAWSGKWAVVSFCDGKA